jgi:hypothetical protein
VLPGGLLASVQAMEQATRPDMPLWQMAMGNALVIALLYLPAGLAGLWLARRADLPGLYRRDAGWRVWLLWPLVIGLLVGGNGGQTSHIECLNNTLRQRISRPDWYFVHHHNASLA